MIGIELVKDQDKKSPAAREAGLVVDEALKRGLLISAIGTYGQTLRITPPLILTREEADISIEIIHDSMKAVEKQT
jgi:4-aminobutyrate aminotransferase